MNYPEVEISVVDHLNPECGYQMRVTNGRTGEVMLATGKNPVTGESLHSYRDCLVVAAMYASTEAQR